MDKNIFSLTAQEGSARAGILRLPHGDVPTPVFMPVGTQGTVKTLSWEDVEGLGYFLVLANTYHLSLRPGVDFLESAGGLHEFTSWKKNILTDSGGYQVFSLANRRVVEEDGVDFSSHVDGTRRRLTPENVVLAQIRMGVDIAMCLDECPPYPCSETEARDMMERTLRWAERCRKTWSDALGSSPSSPRDIQPFSPRTFLFPIAQGSTFPRLRRESAARTAAMEMPGYAVGGLSVGEPREILGEMIEASVSNLPTDKPRYLMGVGRPEDVLEAVERGIDMFDCVWPTRNGRNGQALTWDGPKNLRNNRYRNEAGPVDPECRCMTCRRYSSRYIAHLFRAGEYTGLRLLSLHNLAFMLDFMGKIRRSVETSAFQSFKSQFLERYSRKEP